MSKIISDMMGFFDKYNLHVKIENDKREYIIGAVRLFAFYILIYGLVIVLIKQ